MDQLPRLRKRKLYLFVCYRLLVICGFCSERFPLPLGALNRLHYFISKFPRVFCPVDDFNARNKIKTAKLLRSVS